MPRRQLVPAFCGGAPLLDGRRNWNVKQALVPRRPARYTAHRAARVTASVAAGWAAARTQEPPAFKEDVPATDGYMPGAPIAEPLPLTIDDLMAIVKNGCPDSWPNEIIRILLGWRQNEDGSWDDSHVPAEWLESYPKGPPDFIGDPTDYSREKDMPVKLAVQKMVRSVLPEHKNGFREVMKPAGFPGWKVADLTPNRTRRAQCVNYIIFWYRMHFPEYVWE